MTGDGLLFWTALLRVRAASLVRWLSVAPSTGTGEAT